MSFLPFFHELEESLKSSRDTAGVRLSAWPLLILGIVFGFMSFVFFTTTITQAVQLALFLSPLWIMPIIVEGAWFLYITLRRSQFIAAQHYILLEIKPPRSVVKTPLAMETVLSSLNLTKGESNWYQLYVQGQVRPYWSLEIASLEGQVHFYIWTRSNFRKLVESAVYAQYPGAQVVEAEDYTRTIAATPGEGWGVWGCDFKETQKSPYPIKTYVEYGLDKVSEEPEQTDPLANLIEFMGSMKKGEYFWLQYTIRYHAGKEKYHGKRNASGKYYTWKDEAAEIVKKIREETRSSYFDPIAGKEMPGFPNPTKGQSDTMAAIERNVAKQAFDVGARALYIARPDKFDPINITGMIGLFKAFSSEGWNGIKATGWMMEYSDYPWEVGNNIRKAHRAKELVDAYRRRQHFHEPHGFEYFMVMSTEELATLYRIPSKSVESPALARIASATATAPINLPT